VAASIRTKEGKIRTFTNHQAVGDGAAWGCSGACCSACCSSCHFSAWRSALVWAP
jgi:hypothetical protein